MLARRHGSASLLAGWLVGLVLVGYADDGLTLQGASQEGRCRFGRVYDGQQCVWPQAGQPVPCVNGWTPMQGGCAQPVQPPARPADVGGHCYAGSDCDLGLDCVEGSCRDRDQDAASSFPHEAPDAPRFRGAISVEGGAFIVPDPGTGVAAVGVQAEVGVQVNDVLGIYFVPGVGGIFDSEGGTIASEAAVVLDITAADAFTIGAGPGVSVVGPGIGYEGRVHLAVHPYCVRGEDGVRRKAFTIAADVRFEHLTVDTFFTSTTAFIVQPTLLVGYTAF